MGRFVVVRDHEHGGERLVEESAVPTEAALHEVLMRHPSLVPSTDLGFGRVVTVGFETSLASGSADLVLLDEEGRVCVVEVKKEGNPDTRRVVAQMLDYAAALWGMSIEQFERTVLRGKQEAGDPRTLRELVIDELVGDAEDPEEAADRTLEGLADHLQTGDFALVLAAPTIPAGVQRVIEYLNARGHSVFGLEVSYFHGDVDAFVPRLVVKPSIGSRIAGQAGRAAATPIDTETLIASLPDPAAHPVQSFLEQACSHGGELDWKENRVRVRVRGQNGPKVTATIQPDIIWVTYGAIKGLDPQPGRRAAARLSELANVTVGTHYASLKFAGATAEQIDAILDVAAAYIDELVRSVEAGAAPSDGRSATAIQDTANGTPEERSEAAQKAWATRRGT